MGSVEIFVSIMILAMEYLGDVVGFKTDMLKLEINILLRMASWRLPPAYNQGKLKGILRISFVGEVKAVGWHYSPCQSRWSLYKEE